jgi:hypothetical protein
MSMRKYAVWPCGWPTCMPTLTQRGSGCGLPLGLPTPLLKPSNTGLGTNPSPAHPPCWPAGAHCQQTGAPHPHPRPARAAALPHNSDMAQPCLQALLVQPRQCSAPSPWMATSLEMIVPRAAPRASGPTQQLLGRHYAWSSVPRTVRGMILAKAASGCYCASDCICCLKLPRQHAGDNSGHW